MTSAPGRTRTWAAWAAGIPLVAVCGALAGVAIGTDRWGGGEPSIVLSPGPSGPSVAATPTSGGTMTPTVVRPTPVLPGTLASPAAPDPAATTRPSSAPAPTAIRTGTPHRSSDSSGTGTGRAGPPTGKGTGR